MLTRMMKESASSPQKLKQNFKTLLSENNNNTQPRNASEREALFKECMAWRQKQRSSSR
jgi:hypothetical protein